MISDKQMTPPPPPWKFYKKPGVLPFTSMQLAHLFTLFRSVPTFLSLSLLLVMPTAKVVKMKITVMPIKEKEGEW